MSSDPQVAEFILTSAQIKALGGYVILAAPGAGYMWQATVCMTALIAGSDAGSDPLIADDSIYLATGVNTIQAVLGASDLGAAVSRENCVGIEQGGALSASENLPLKLLYAGTPITGNAAGNARLFCAVNYRLLPI